MLTTSHPVIMLQPTYNSLLIDLLCVCLWLVFPHSPQQWVWVSTFSIISTVVNEHHLLWFHSNPGWPSTTILGPLHVMVCLRPQWNPQLTLQMHVWTCLHNACTATSWTLNMRCILSIQHTLPPQALWIMKSWTIWYCWELKFLMPSHTCHSISISDLVTASCIQCPWN